MRNASVWGALLGVEKTVIERVEVDEGGDGEGGAGLVAHVRPARGVKCRCGVCQRRCGR